MADAGNDLAADRCTRCGTMSLWPRHACRSCGATLFETALIDGRGVVYSVTHVHRPAVSGANAEGPYAIALIALEAGGRLMARVSLSAAIGDPVRATRAKVDDVPIVFEGLDSSHFGSASA